MQNAPVTATLLAISLGLAGHMAAAAGEPCGKGTASGTSTACADVQESRTEQLDPNESPGFLDRAFQTRVGTHPAALEPEIGEDLCSGGNDARETIAMHMAERLQEEGADALARGDMVERKISLKLPCP